MATARKITDKSRREAAAEKAAQGIFPPLDDCIKALRLFYIEEGRIPDSDDRNIEAPQDYPWLSILEYIERKTDNSASDLMEKTLAGFPPLHEILFEFHLNNNSVKPWEKSKEGFPWTVLLSVLKAHVKKSIVEGYSIPEDRRVQRHELKNSAKPMIEMPMKDKLAEEIQKYRESYAQYRDAQKSDEKARKTKAELERAEASEAVERQIKPQAPAVFQAKSNTPAPEAKKPAKTYKYDIEQFANAIRDIVRETGSPPKSTSKDPFTIGNDHKFNIGRMNTALRSQKDIVANKGTISSASDLMSRIGFLQELHFPLSPELIKEISARDAFNLVANYAKKNKGMLPTMDVSVNGDDFRNELLAKRISVATLSVAFQQSKVTQWEEFVEEYSQAQPIQAKRTGITKDTRVPLCLYDFMVVTGFATRNEEYDPIEVNPMLMPQPLGEPTQD